MFNSFLAIWIGYKLASFVTLFLKIRERRMKLLCSTELNCLGSLGLGEHFNIKTYVRCLQWHRIIGNYTHIRFKVK